MTSPLTACTGMPDRVISATRSACRVRASAVTNSSETRAPLRKASETACGPAARKARARCRSARLVSRRAALSRGLRTLVYSEPLPSGSGTACLSRQVRPGHFDQRGERSLVGHGQLGQHAPVDLDLGRLQALDEAVVGDAVGPGGRVDALDPQPPEGALAVLAVAVGVGHRVELLLLGLAVQPGPLAPVAAGPLEDGAALLLGVRRPLDACHFLLLRSLAGGLLTQQLLDLADVVPGDGPFPREPARHAGRLVLEQVVLAGPAAHHLAGTGQLEALRGAAVGLHLRHVAVVSLFSAPEGASPYLRASVR